MKKFLSIVFSALALSGFAQQKAGINGNHQLLLKPNSPGEAEINASLEKGRANLEALASMERGGGGTVFFEDFANGFDGNNGIGGWLVEDSGGGTIWMMANANSPGGFYTNTSPALNSTTKTNGWVIFDADLYQGGEITAANPVENVMGYLTSPAIDCSQLGSVIVEFQQYFRYCCFNSLPLFLEVSNDGGNSWTVFSAEPNWESGTNVTSANPVVSRIDISGPAANQSSVILRWGFQPVGTLAYSHYFWGLDDILVYENPVQNDMLVRYVSTGDIQNDFEYRAIPLELAIPAEFGGMIVGTIYENIGSAPQNVTVTAEILSEDESTVLATVSETFTALNNGALEDPTETRDTIFVATEWYPEAIGNYWVRTTLTMEGEDATPANNTMKKKFAITLDEYGHNDPTINNGNMMALAGTGTAADPFQPHGYGAYYSVNVDGSVAYGITVRFDNTCDTGTPFNVLLLQQNEDFNLSDAEYITGKEYEVDNAWTPNGINSFPYYLPFDNEAELSAGSLYFAGVQAPDEGLLELTIQSTPEVDRDLSTGIWAETTTNEWIWFFGLPVDCDHSPSVRLIVSERVGVTELNAQSDLESFVVTPNPASSEARINFSLAGSKVIAYEIRDISGKLMDWKNVGQFSPGQNSIALDVTKFPAGNYFVNLVVDGARVYTQKMNVTR